MNANELADAFTKTTNGAGDIYQQAATMLRKQALEIEYWRIKFNKAMELQENVNQRKKW
jgi:hypothetical protein